MTEITPRIIPPASLQHLLDKGYLPALAKIFAARGITDSGQLDNTFAGLLPFDNLKNAGEMARLLADAITARKKLMVIADYDADGATACAVAVRGLRALGAQIGFIVPNRFEYGYGLTPEIVRLAAKQSPNILITVDNGIASVEGVAEANRLGMQVLIRSSFARRCNAGCGLHRQSQSTWLQFFQQEHGRCRRDVLCVAGVAGGISFTRGFCR